MEQTIEQQAKKVAEEKGWTLLETRKAPHPEDFYLIYTLVEVPNKYALNGKGKDYATHLFNGSIGGFAYGHYDIQTLASAKVDLEKRCK